jgi:signal transduction histidine kinase
VISGVGHQLNNKLVPVMGYCQLLAQQKTLPPEALGRIDMIQVASGEMRVIIDKLLRLAKVRERIVTTLEPHECVHIALDLLSGHIETQKIRLELDLIEKAPELKGDADLLLQALLAILHRSCTSFTVEQSYRWLKVATHQSGAFFHIQIEDNGTGLGTYDSDDMLDPLVPLEEIGHGQIFSYNIPRNVIRRHGGLLHVKDRDSGGKCATIDLPLH